MGSFSQASILRTLLQFGWLTDSMETYFSRKCKTERERQREREKERESIDIRP